MRALVFEDRWSAAVGEVPEPRPGPGELLLRPRFVGLCGTDLELLSGQMPYFAAGLARYPLRPGHEVSAVVAAPGGRWAVGTEVVVDPVIGCGRCAACGHDVPTRCEDREEVGVRRGRPGGAAELLCVPERNAHPLPANVTLRDAPLVEPGVTALHAVRRVDPAPGARALVIGAGTLGAIAAQLLIGRGVEVELPLVDRARAALVERLGARPVDAPRAGAYDIAIEAAGTPEAAYAAIDATRPGGQVAFVGIQPRPLAAFDLNQVVLKDLRLHGVINGAGLYDAMLAELANGTVDAGALVDEAFALDDAPDALARLADPGRARPKVLLEI